tara:strand:+ start:640 stop:1008 length:369 start_codon:yes stop_codon:yes gene_type:complete
MGDLIDLDAFRKKQEEEAKAIAAEAALIKAEEAAAEEQADIDYMQDVLSEILGSLGKVLSGSMIEYTTPDGNFPGSTNYSSGDYALGAHYHEAGYNEDGYYEKSWDFDPLMDEYSDEEEDDV